MKRPVWIRIVVMVLAIILAGCTTNPMVEETIATTEANISETTNATEDSSTENTEHEHEYLATEVVASTCTSEGYTVYVCDCGDTYNGDQTEMDEHIYEETVIASTTEAEGYTLYMCTVCGYAYKDNYVDKLAEDALTDEQKKSVAMLNYLAALTQKINTSQNSRMFLEEAYAAIINNTNLEGIHEITKSHLASLLDIIEEYRIVAVKRERLEYIYNQNKAKAIREAIPNPVSILSAASSLDMKRLVASVAYMAVDSVSSYKAYNDELDQTFLQDGWVLDDEEAANLHESRKYAFLYRADIVSKDKLPKELALNEIAIENFVTWTNNENVYQRLQFLESEEDTYRAFGNYWLARAECHYELQDYESCLNAIEMYKEYQADIFNKDYYLAQVLPKAIAAAEEVYSAQEYISYAEENLKILVDNTVLQNTEDGTQSGDWTLRYFAAQTYVDLYTKTNDIKYLDQAYELALNNVNYLVTNQKKLTSSYCADLELVEIPDDATKEEEKQIKEYNKSLKDNRKTALPELYEPLLLNCELLFALLEKVDVSAAEKTKLDAILGVSGTNVFLTKPIANRYASASKAIDIAATFDKSSITIPAYCVSANSVIRVSVTEAGKTIVYDDWRVKEVKRDKNGFESFVVTYTSKKAKDQKWSADSTVLIEIFDEVNSKYEPITIRFKVSKYVKFIAAVEFEQVG